MRALICGSMAFDTIMVFEDHFRRHILPEQVHILNVSFLAPSMRREFGGCAGNIAYTLNLLGHEALPMATVGQDFDPYALRMDAHGISRRYLQTVADSYTAQAFITTDLDDNQITAFHPGAMMFSHLNRVPARDAIDIGMVSPDGKDGMIEHAQQFAEAGIPFAFDPGQGMVLFDGKELLACLDLARWAILNDYEARLLQDRTGQTLEVLARRVEALVVTRGAEGSLIYANGTVLEIPAARADAVLDPTGCGDAYRAGFLYGLLEDLDWETTGRVAALLGAIKVAHHGTQNHSFTMADLRDRFFQAFGYRF